MKVLVAPDKFKGTLSAREAAKSMARGWKRARPLDTLELLPITDGGDGFGEALSELIGGKALRIKTLDAAHRPIAATWWWEANSKTAVIESANVIGLAMLPSGRFHPFNLDTFGLGAVLRGAQRKGAKRIIVGIGGSATNDGGFGLARALGWDFFDANGRPIKQWTGLHALTDLRAPKRRLSAAVCVAVDVQNPLLGLRGATRVYGPQKGLRAEDFATAERCFRRLAAEVKRLIRRDFARVPGAGAAGGLGFGLMAFADAQWEQGFELFSRRAGFSRRLRVADCVLTGEGALDASTAMGKGVGQLAEMCRKRGIPCVGLAGVVVGSRKLAGLFTKTHALTEVTTLAKAKQNASAWLERLAAKAASDWRPLKQAKA